MFTRLDFSYSMEKKSKLTVVDVLIRFDHSMLVNRNYYRANFG